MARRTRLVALGFLVTLVATMSFVGVAPASAQTGFERIHNYDVDISIQGDGDILVVERIDYDFASSPHHGIFREVPVRLTYDDRNDRLFPLHVISVVGSPGTPDAYKLEKEGNLLRIRIGDADRTITGPHTYTITYRVEGALNGFEDHDELYWNAIGTSWSVPIDEATVRVTAPADVQQVACFAGPEHSSLPCSSATVDGSAASFRQSAGEFRPVALLPFEGLTVVVGIPPGAVPTPVPILKERWNLARAFAVTGTSLGLAGGLLILVLLGLVRILWVIGRDRRAIGSPTDIAYGTANEGEQAVPLFEKGTYPVEYAPPDDIRPGQVGTLVDEVAGPVDVTATIVDLAVRGYLRIEEIPKKGWFGKPDWRLVKLKESGETLLHYESLLLDSLFEDADEDEPEDEDPQDDVPERPDTHTPVHPSDDGLARVRLSSLKRKFSARLKKVEDALYDDVVQRRWFAGRPDKVRRSWGARGWALFIAGDALTWLLAAKTHLGLLGLPVIVAGLLLIWSAHWMPRRTAKGTGLVRRVLGFRTYIDTAEAEEARFQERENIFATYLPFAVVFGLTQKWARTFAGLDGQPPDTSSWYVGSRPFTVASFSSSIDHFSTTTAGTITSTPAGSGSSGFGGGGSSGGGGGGGGGGSW